MTKIILHGEYGSNSKQLIVDKSVIEGDMWWVAIHDGESVEAALKIPRNVLLEFAYTIIDEFEEDDVEETPKSYVEVVE